MATMVKEKRREKKKPKEKHAAKMRSEEDQPTISNLNEDSHSTKSPCLVEQNSTEPTSELLACSTEIAETLQALPDYILSEPNSEPCENITENSQKLRDSLAKTHEREAESQFQQIVVQKSLENVYEELNSKLDRLSIPKVDPDLDTDELLLRLNSPGAYVKQEVIPLIDTAESNVQTRQNISLTISEFDLSQTLQQNSLVTEETLAENMTPSAPVFEEEQMSFHQREHISPSMKVEVPELQCMDLEEAVRVFGGKEMEEIRVMGEREEAIVEAGPISGPEHPLVDLLSTFRSSLKAVDLQRTQLACGFSEEVKFRDSLWKVEKRKLYVVEKCPCGASVELKGSYEHAVFVKERLPLARMRLEGLLRDLQDSYCHHQHEALLAHCQIEELISETIQSNKNAIREALALILQALRLADSGPEALCAALQRWAAVLAGALVDQRDVRQLLYLLQHLFRQTRSVRWAAQVVRFDVCDVTAAARAVAILDLVLAKPRLEAAVECTEETEDVWEEVDRHGSGAVSDGSVRERDLLALLRAFPLRMLLARLVLLTHSDLTQARSQDWCDPTSGRGVLRACCGVRALLATFARAVAARVHYRRLHDKLRRLAADALHCLAGLHAHCSPSYGPELAAKISSELAAAFAAGCSLLNCSQLHRLPASLLSEEVARDYCIAVMVGLHDASPKQLPTALRIELPLLCCEDRVLVVAQAAVDRAADHELARMVVEFLLQVGLKRKAATCKGSCDAAARDALPRILAAHPYLHAMTLHIVADLYQGEPLDPAAIKPLSASRWRPTTGELRAVLDDWLQRCAPLLQHLLLALDYTPHTGISLETQLAIGSWLCGHQRPAPEWAWVLLRRLYVHRAAWGAPLDAPDPEGEPADLFGSAYAVLSSSWGHCVPLICTSGVAALCRVAAARPRDAAHCLAPVMAVMAQSPESVACTPQFTELLNTLLNSGPTIVQRALGLGPTPGCDILLTIVLQQLEGNQYPAISRASLLSAWLHALWSPALSTGSILDTALLACREWTQFDAHTKLLLQQPTAKEHITHAVRVASTAPLVCECVLRGASAHAHAQGDGPRLLDALHRQRALGERIHVDNALKQIGSNMSADDLVVHRAAAAVLAAPMQHPAHLTLWRLLMHHYLQRPPSSMLESTPPVGPLFFSGLIKSRVLTQLKAKLSETAKYHRNELESLKSSQNPSSQSQNQNSPSKSNAPKSTSNENDDNILPALSIRDLTRESSDSGSSDSESSTSEESDGDSSREVRTEEGVSRIDAKQMIGYHAGAEKMVREFARWLDEGDKTRAMPHHADIALFIAEPALEAGWKSELSRRRPPCQEEEPRPPLPAPPPRAPPTPFHAVIRRLLKIRDRSSRRTRKPTIPSPTEDINFNDNRQILRRVDEHLSDIETLAREWSNEAARVATLDSQLWGLMANLRVSQPLPPVKRSCANKCRPVTIIAPHREWCVSPGAERGVRENRTAARAAVRRLARPRPHAARSAAALHAIARHVGSVQAARAIAERAWYSADAAAPSCAPAHAALATLVENLADKWLCHDGHLCSELISRWCSGQTNPLQQALVSGIVQPRKLPLAHWPAVYVALLKARLPSHTVFSYLSKFEMARWSQSVDSVQRRQVLEALAAVAQRWGPAPDEEHHVLLELIGVHTTAVLDVQELGAHMMRCVRASVGLALPPAHWPHLVAAAEACAVEVPFDQLGHLLRDIGACWWEARSALKGRTEPLYAEYSPHVAALLHSLLRAFVAAAVAMSYAAERVSWYAWSALQESWSPWIAPHPTETPLLPSTTDDEHYTPMLKRFVHNMLQVMADCPGTETNLLQQTFEWAIQTHFAVNAASPSQESRVQLSALLGELTALPWTEHQWVHHKCLQICTSNDKEILSWCGATWRDTAAEAWLTGVTDDQLAPTLATLLYVFTTMPQHPQALEQATRLPWWRFPEMALDEALDRFFAQHHNPVQPYHDLPQFSLLLFSAELSIHPSAPAHAVTSSRARAKRAHGVSAWTRAACSPALAAHVPTHCTKLLGVVTELGPRLESSEGELEELLGRALVIMCLEPAATNALPVWQRWLRSAPPRLVSASLSAVAGLTAFEYFASLADDAVRAHIANTETPGWSEVTARWGACHWTDVTPLVSRARLHAAHGVVRAHRHGHGALRAAFLALVAADLNFVENEPIVALWICVVTRVALGCGDAGEEAESGDAARALLKRWAEEPRRSLLQMVTLAADSGSPTANHRLLSRLALCIVSNSDGAARAYEAACVAVLGSSPGDVLHWGRQPHPKRLPRLAMRLFPNCDRYFRDELDFAPEDS